MRTIGDNYGEYGSQLMGNYRSAGQKIDRVRILGREIADLQTKGFLYHATPLHRLESVLEKGLLVRESSKGCGRKRYLCLTEHLDSALHFVHHVQLWDNMNPIVGAIGVDLSKLPESIKSGLSEDPLFNGGVITRKDIKPRYFGELILVDLEGNTENLVELAKNLQGKYELETKAIDYHLGERRFEFRMD